MELKIQLTTLVNEREEQTISKIEIVSVGGMDCSYIWLGE